MDNVDPDLVNLLDTQADQTDVSLGVRLCFWFLIPGEKPRTKTDPLANAARNQEQRLTPWPMTPWQMKV